MGDSKSKSSNHFARFSKFVLTVALSIAALPVVSADKPYCKWGDCKNGLGEKVFPQPNGSEYSYVSNFSDGKRNGYTISFTDTWVCESEFKGGFSNGFRLCAVKAGDQGVRYMEANRTKKGSPYFYKNSRGRLISVGRWMGSENVWPELIDTKKIRKELNALRKKGKELEEFLPHWFPEKVNVPTESEMRTLVAKDLAADGNSASNVDVAKSPEITQRRGGVQPACEFGDCENGFGSYRFKSGDQHIGYFKNTRQHGYGILLQEIAPRGKRICETLYQDGRRTGLRVCLNQSSNVASAYYYSDGGKANGRGISWRASSGDIVRLGLWRDDQFIREEAADLTKISSDWQSIKDSPQAVMRASFLTDEFLALKLPSQDDQSEWLRRKELERTKKTHVIPEEAPFKLGCISGDCENGFGEFSVRESTFVGEFEQGQLSGYVLITSPEKQCEGQMNKGLHGGVEHCVSLKNGNHSFSRKTGVGRDGVQIAYEPDGTLVEYSVYKNGVKEALFFESRADKQRLAASELVTLLDELADLKSRAPQKSGPFRVKAIDDIPVPKADLPATSADGESPAPEQVLNRDGDNRGSKAAAMRPTGSTKTEATNKGTPQVVSSAPKKQGEMVIGAQKTRLNIQRLALIAAELNGGSRQINFNFRLERVRVEPAAYELIYEFFAAKPIDELDTNVIMVANQIAYCSASKLQPFREAKMPARWSYIDAKNETFEMMTRESDC